MTMFYPPALPKCTSLTTLSAGRVFFPVSFFVFLLGWRKKWKRINEDDVKQKGFSPLLRSPATNQGRLRLRRDSLWPLTSTLCQLGLDLNSCSSRRRSPAEIGMFCDIHPLGKPCSNKSGVEIKEKIFLWKMCEKLWNTGWSCWFGTRLVLYK